MKQIYCVLVLCSLQVLQAKEVKQATLIVSAPIESGALQQTFNAIGSLSFSQQGMLASEVSGVIDAVLVAEGQNVKKGQVLAVLNSELLKYEIQSKAAMLKQVKAQYEKIKKDYERYASLYASASVSLKEYEDILLDMQAQEGNRDSIANDLELLKAQKRKKSIVAPYDGVILEALLQQGEWVNAGASVFKIAKLTPLEATFEVSFEVLRALKVGESLEVQIAGVNYPAKVSALIPLGDVKSHTFPVKLTINDTKGELIEGLDVRASFRINEGGEILSVPRDAIIPVSNQQAIFVVDHGVAREVFVRVQGYEGLRAYIVPLNRNLSPKDSVIVVGMERLRDGDLVQEASND